MEVFLGIPAADGVGIGTAFVIPDPVKRAITQHHIKIDQLNEGWSRFEYASQNVIFELNSYLDSLSRTDPKDKIQREVFETYILMLEDPVFLKETREFYEKELFTLNVPLCCFSPYKEFGVFYTKYIQLYRTVTYPENAIHNLSWSLTQSICISTYM